MADPYLAISEIANDDFMQERMMACASQQQILGNVHLMDPLGWVVANRYIWASTPTWGEKWKYAQDSNTSNPDYEPGKDEACITDEDILSVVQLLGNPQETPES